MFLTKIRYNTMFGIDIIRQKGWSEYFRENEADESEGGHDGTRS
jgi:hypothetical protein